MTLPEFIARQRNELARFQAECERAELTKCDDEDEWFRLMAEFFEDGAC